MELQTGLWTLRLLAASLAITPLRRLTHLNWLVKYRRPIGLFAFFYACLHVLTYLGVHHYFVWADILEDVIEHKYVTVGAIAFLTLIPLALTSTKGWIRRLGRRWGKLHRLVYVTAIAGTVHYLWSVKKDTFDPLVYLSVFVFLLGFRLVVWWRGRTRASAPAAGAGGRAASSTA